MGKFNLNCGVIEGYSVKIVDEGEGHKVIILKIVSETEEVEYRICADDREPDLNKTHKDLQSALQKAKNEDEEDFAIDEFPERDYVYVSDSDGKRRQYTGQRLSHKSKVAPWK